MSKFFKKIPEFVWIIDSGEWKQGPYVNPPKRKINLRKFKLVEILPEKNNK